MTMMAVIVMMIVIAALITVLILILTIRDDLIHTIPIHSIHSVHRLHGICVIRISELTASQVIHHARLHVRLHSIYIGGRIGRGHW